MATAFLTLPVEGGKYYHVCKASSYDGPVFITPANYLFFLKRFNLLLGPMVDLLAYSLLPNQFHFVFFARDVITIKEEYVDHPGDIGHFISETLRKLFSTYGITLVKQEGMDQNTIILDQNFYRVALLDEEMLKQVICAVHYLPVKSGVDSEVGKYTYDSYQGIVAKGKSVVDKDLLFSLFGDKPQFIEQSELAPNWESSPLFALMNIS